MTRLCLKQFLLRRHLLLVLLRYVWTKPTNQPEPEDQLTNLTQWHVLFMFRIGDGWCLLEVGGSHFSQKLLIWSSCSYAHTSPQNNAHIYIS